ncbi:hypothetical protein BC335_1155 [Lactobacillus helveticus]|uniref:Type I restriction modification DNA specificity domain-containing protein n=2 Tax=Lactobacillus helveticus TaxID=1587 RepID=A0A386RER4_LACHE|nr:restriction endonuclease subunit S [Lactobacillus helveticus]AYE61621.1 hypothetical protein BC335_1155 [Lactobacillus helveticus]MCD9225196.1 restriction endonuclease subunit S [Lactobacillus helveticus]
MNKKDAKKAPVLRFKGFTNDWEQRKLSDETNRIRSYSISHGFEVAEDTGTKYIHYGDIHTGKVKNINNINVLPNIEDNNYKPLKYGDVIVADASEDYKGIADACIVNTISNSYKIVAGLHTIAFRPKSKLCSKFLYFYLSTDIFKHFGYKTGTGLKVFGISYKELAKFKLKEPSATEQKKIVKLLFLIEKAIHLQQRKLRLLKLLKKATQQNIFASTECLPKLKYRNLTGKWQLYRLKDVAKITMGQSPNSKNYTQNPIDHILVQGNADIRNGYVFPRIWTTEITKIANRGDIILCVRAPAGDVGKTKFNVVIGRGVAAIKGNDFIFQQLQFMKSSGYWKKYISGSTFESINSNDIKNAKIFCPSQLEQKNISSLLDDIDTSIQIQQKNILDFKYIKQFLLQNMFI